MIAVATMLLKVVAFAVALGLVIIAAGFYLASRAIEMDDEGIAG